jgi:hypothetical protein
LLTTAQAIVCRLQIDSPAAASAAIELSRYKACTRRIASVTAATATAATAVVAGSRPAATAVAAAAAAAVAATTSAAAAAAAAVAAGGRIVRAKGVNHPSNPPTRQGRE